MIGSIKSSLKLRFIETGLAVFISFESLAAYPKDVEMSNQNTLCFGRFLIDFPAGGKIKEIGQQSQFMFGDIHSDNFQGEIIDFTRRMDQREIKLRELTGKDDRVLIRTISPNQSTRIFVTKENVFGHVDFGFEAYKLDKNKLFSLIHINFEEKIFYDKVLIRLSTDLLPNLRTRHLDEIPSEPGFCIKDGFIADDGSKYQFEEARLQFNFKELPDVWVAVYSQTVPKAGDDTLLQRMDKHPDTVLEKLYIKTFRRQKHEVNGFKGEELLELLPTDQGIKQHYFHWEAAGAVKSIFVPLLNLEFESAVLPLKGPRPRPSLTDEQAIKLYDSIVNSIRLRPTSAPAKTGASDLPKKPLGELALTGRICPQTGWWQSGDEYVLPAKRRQYFKEGEMLPTVEWHGKPNVWQKLTGERPSQTMTTVWKLVEYAEAQRAAIEAEKPPAAPAAEDAGPVKEG
ncbi:T6SS immunity protein Tli4 family protein [Rugamonas sp. CCM 8940]|uniref:T6SS immunity protein Tli4 family protein n=1 Tax=Rugamonas sp. CCM 8940 TaxID=2765359 RepID=UPI0018F2DEBF|nr:T6SS immunity protein Tli4 family protein [Rugamonas sp. CCM 8940]MBJ7312824.1 hypothetical protein [Rugamonas sp. CCM 8940]